MYRLGNILEYQAIQALKMSSLLQVCTLRPMAAGSFASPRQKGAGWQEKWVGRFGVGPVCELYSGEQATGDGSNMSALARAAQFRQLSFRGPAGDGSNTVVSLLRRLWDDCSMLRGM